MDLCTHNGWQITHRTRSDCKDVFAAHKEGATHTAGSLSNLIKAIDNHGEAEKVFKRIPALFCYTYNHPIPCEITSFIENGSRYPEAWISFRCPEDTTPQRRKVCISDLYQDTPENRKISERMGRLDRASERISRHRHNLLAEITRFRKP